MGVRKYMVPVEEALANKFFPKLLVLESISRRLNNLLAMGAKSSGLGIPNPIETAYKIHWTSMARSEYLVEYLITRYYLLTIKHQA